MSQAFTYTGELAIRELWGVSFPRGVAVTVENLGLIKKCEALDDFEAGEVEIAPLEGQVFDAEPFVREIEALKAENADLKAKLAAYEAADEAALEIPHPGAPKEEAVIDEPDDDYVPTEEQEPEPDMPTLGEGVLPDDWREAHWKTKQAWCRDLLGIGVKNGDEATAFLEEALKS